MVTCEKCWADAFDIAQSSGEPQSDAYYRLICERVGVKMCTPEQQAGDDAKKCLKCNRWTLHQVTGVCVICGFHK